MKFSVAIPTYKRPEELKRAINSVVNQRLEPFELIVVSRLNDFPTNKVIATCIEQYSNIEIKHAFVEDAGFLPPIFEAVRIAKGDVLALLDDDAEARKDWLERIANHYQLPNVAGVGGRCINFCDGVEQKYPRTNTFGKLCWHGKPIGNMYKAPMFSDPVYVDFLMGGNSSFKLEILKQSLPDTRLRRDVSFYWEMDVGLQVKKIGYQLIFDPKVIVAHYSAPRDTPGLRTINYEGVYWSNYNYAVLMRKHLNSLRFSVYVVFTFLVGWSGSPGIIRILLSLLQSQKVEWRNMIFASLSGRMKGLLSK